MGYEWDSQGDRDFPSTHWTLIAHAQGPPSPAFDEALAWLCRRYWYPLYAYIRRRGNTPEAAEDLTQEFFARLLDKEILGGVDPTKGKFRAYLLACCKHFLANQAAHDRAAKRGGGRSVLSIDTHDAERRYLSEPTDDLTAEALFHRRWAMTILQRVMDVLREEYAAKNQVDLLEMIMGGTIGDSDAPSYRQIADKIGSTEAAVKKQAQRFRERYRAELRSQIAETVDGPEQVNDEVRSLIAALAAPSGSGLGTP